MTVNNYTWLGIFLIFEALFSNLLFEILNIKGIMFSLACALLGGVFVNMKEIKHEN